MKYNKLIAIAGLKNSGKDTVAKMLQYLLNTPKFMHNYLFYNLFNWAFKTGVYRITSFASSLKKTLAAFLDIPVTKFEDRDFKEKTYVFFPTMTITANPPKGASFISDSKFSKMCSERNFSFLNTHYITIRQLLQVFGTEVMRNIFGDKLWILKTIKSNKPTIISDLRFLVEYSAIKENDGIVIYVDRDCCVAGKHASEKTVLELLKKNKYDLIFTNNSTKKALFNQIKNKI